MQATAGDDKGSHFGGARIHRKAMNKLAAPLAFFPLFFYRFA